MYQGFFMRDILSSEEACKYLKISKSTLLKYSESGKIPAFKLGPRWRYSRSDLERWVKMRTEQDTDARFKARLRKISIKGDNSSVK